VDERKMYAKMRALKKRELREGLFFFMKNMYLEGMFYSSYYRFDSYGLKQIGSG